LSNKLTRVSFSEKSGYIVFNALYSSRNLQVKLITFVYQGMHNNRG